MALRELGVSGDTFDNGMVITERIINSISQWFKPFCIAHCLLKSAANNTF
jgi:hypothetical protein